MTQPLYFDTCRQLAQRYLEATNGCARVLVDRGAQDTLVLTYQSSCPAGGTLPYETVFETTLGGRAAVDSLVAHLACALETNSEGFELASLHLDDPLAAAGRVAVRLYCPAWQTSCTLHCVYRSETRPGARTVTIYPIPRQYLDDSQQEGWHMLERSGLESQLDRLLPWAAQALAQLLELNAALDTPARVLYLPGEHRRNSPYPHQSIVLDGFDDQSQYWLIDQTEFCACIETPAGPLELRTNDQEQMLAASVARWQTLCEAVAEQLEPPRTPVPSEH